MNSPNRHDREWAAAVWSIARDGPQRMPVHHRAAGALPEDRTRAALQSLGLPDDHPARREVEQALDTLDAHLLHVDQASQTLQPLDVPGTVVSFPIPAGGLHQPLRFIQAKRLFRDNEEVGDHSDRKTGPGVPVRFHQNRSHSPRFDWLFHLKATLYFRYYPEL